jgi:hypothetical protein
MKPRLATAALAAVLLTTAAAVSAAHWLLDRKLVIANPGREAFPAEALGTSNVPVPVSVILSGNAR